MKYTATLIAINSARDSSGNTYWAFRFIDHQTGKEVVGQFSGGDSNIYGVLRHWNAPDDWDRSILYHRIEWPKRLFKTNVSDWPYAGCDPKDIAAFIRNKLAGE